jgi:hypothetical protein
MPIRSTPSLSLVLGNRADSERGGWPRGWLVGPLFRKRQSPGHAWVKSPRPNCVPLPSSGSPEGQNRRGKVKGSDARLGGHSTWLDVGYRRRESREPPGPTTRSAIRDGEWPVIHRWFAERSRRASWPLATDASSRFRRDRYRGEEADPQPWSCESCPFAPESLQPGFYRASRLGKRVRKASKTLPQASSKYFQPASQAGPCFHPSWSRIT